MPFVVDASVAICWLMPDEDYPVASAALRKTESDSIVVPGIWWFETRNILLVNERRGRVESGKTAEVLEALRKLPVEVDIAAAEDQLMSLARTCRLTVYDAAYLELAQRRSCELATLDKAPLAAARTVSVSILDGASS